MGLVNIPNGLLEQVSKDGMSMLFGGENSGDVNFNKQINHGTNCDVINNGGIKSRKNAKDARCYQHVEVHAKRKWKNLLIFHVS